MNFLNDRPVNAAIRFAASLFAVATLSEVRLEAETLQRVSAQALTFPIYPASTNYVLEPLGQLPPLWCIAAAVAPGETNRMFFLNQAGGIVVVPNLNQPQQELFLDISLKTYHGHESGLLGLAFHPKFQINGTFFVFYTTFADGPQGRGIYDRLSRFQADPSRPNRAMPESEIVLISQFDEDPNHNAGDLAFGPDGYLYVALGDEGGGNDSLGNASVLDGDFFSGILRIDVDGRPGNLEPNPHPSVHPGTYTVPWDNPFVELTQLAIGGTVLKERLHPSHVRTEFFAFGLRNPWRMSFQAGTGALFAIDVGENSREEVNKIVRGGFYGWPFREGTIPWPWDAPEGGWIDPVFEYSHAGGRMAITGGVWCQTDLYPELKGGFVVSDMSGAVGVARLEETTRPIKWIAQHSGLLFSLALHPGTGEILAMDGTHGTVMVLKRKVVQGAPLPERLSQTGIFSDLKELRPNPGIVPYEINVPFWSDGASKKRWFSLPDSESKMRFAASGNWDFPTGSLWVKHFEIPIENEGTTTVRRIETRVLVRQASGVFGATYKWNEVGTDASLVGEEGLDELFNTGSLPESWKQLWHYPSRLECLQCHTQTGGYALGFNTGQLNHSLGFANDSKNQIRAMADAGYLEPLPDHSEPWWRLAGAGEVGWSLEHRVRSYLAANCASCHQPGGPSRAAWDARIQVPLASAGLVNAIPVTSVTSEATRVVAPGNLSHSLLYRRVADMEGYHMPPLGTFLRNEEAVRLLEEWILEDLPSRVGFEEWRNEHFGFVIHPLAEWDGDPDQDGWTNEQEHLLRTNPLDPGSAWKLEIETMRDGVRLSYDRLPGLRFELQSSTTLDAAEWSAVEAPENRIFVGSEFERVQRELRGSSEKRFFRMLIFLP